MATTHKDLAESARRLRKDASCLDEMLRDSINGGELTQYDADEIAAHLTRMRWNCDTLSRLIGPTR